MIEARHIPFVDLRRQNEEVGPELRAALDRVLDSSGFILGEEVERFEQEFAAYCGVRHCVGVSSGTAALTIAMSAAGIEAGDEVIVPAHTFIASALAIIHAGATPVLCDVEAETGLISPEAAAAAIGERTASILAVHLYGQTADMRAIHAIADRHDLLVLEDAAQAHGAFEDGRRAGSLGTAAAFSFYPSKNLGALGDGGAITTDRDDIAGQARLIRDLGQRAKYEHVVPGRNERLDGLQAAFLRPKLARLDAWNELRRSRAALYREALAGGPVTSLEERDESTCVYHLFPVRTPDRDDLQARLTEAGVASGVHYPVPLHGHAALAGRVRISGPLTEAEAWAREELSLPMFPELEQDQIEHVAQVCGLAWQARLEAAREQGKQLRSELERIEFERSELERRVAEAEELLHDERRRSEAYEVAIEVLERQLTSLNRRVEETERLASQDRG